MKDISSIVLVILAILSFGIRFFKKANPQPESEPSAPVKRYPKPVSIDREEEPDFPIPQTCDAPVMDEETKPEQTAKAPEILENRSITDDFDLAKAVIYSEILKPRTFDEY